MGLGVRSIRWPSPIVLLMPPVLYGFALTIDQATATVIVGVIVALSSCWQTWKLGQVHTLVNSNFTEAKAARVAAEASLKTSQDLNVHLQQQLDARTGVVPQTPAPLPGAVTP